MRKRRFALHLSLHRHEADGGVTLSMRANPQSTESEQADRQKWLDLALTCLKEAVTAGYDNFEHFEQDTDLTPLRQLPEFQTLLKQRPVKKP